MIILGVILLIVAYLLPLPYPIDEICLVIGWIALVVGLIFLVLSFAGRPVGGRRYWY